jgi:hypothetical protein
MHLNNETDLDLVMPATPIHNNKDSLLYINIILQK